MKRALPAHAFGLAALAALLVAAPAHALPTYPEVRAAHRPSDIVLTDRHGTPIQSLRVDPTIRRLAWTPLADMSPALLAAVVQSEDQRFWQHAGIDWQAVAASAWGNLVNTKTRGASTLTMQLAGLVEPSLARPSAGRSVTVKVDQALAARQLEARWKKSEILEAYLNLVPFRGELVGIGALAQTLFDKQPSGLDANEAAIAAVLVRAPNATPQQVGQRACALLKTQTGAASHSGDCAGVAALAETALVRRGGTARGEAPWIAPHHARRVADANGAAVQATTLDARVQRTAVQALRRHLAELAARNVEDGAVLVLDNASGEVLAWVGSSGDLSGAANVDGIVARRQPGSTLKPFVYELAFEKRLLTPATLIDDAPTEIATGNGLYVPQNYDKSFKGYVSVRSALGGSLNVPAVRTGAMVGTDALYARLQSLGFALPEPAGWYGASLALGSADVTLLALTNAYRALANGGTYSDVVMTPPPAGRERAGARVGNRPRPQPLLDPAATWLTTDILADDAARARTFGLGSHLALHGWAAVKTGTSKDLRDNWCIGFSDRYTVGVWVGNASGAPMHTVSGTAGAAPVWRAVMASLHEGRVSKPPPMPPGVVLREVRYDDGREPPRREAFLAGTEPAAAKGGAPGGAAFVSLRSTDAVGDSARAIGITSPRDGALYALDPDIPPKAQRLTFEGEPGRWRLDGKVIGQGSRVTWQPWPGPHRLELLAPSGEVVQAVGFEVRGAGVRPRRR